MSQNQTVKDAAISAGYTPATAHGTAYDIAKDMLDKGVIDDIRQRNQQAMASLGYGHTRRIQKSCELVEAKKTIAAFDDLKEVPDPSTQLAALKDLHKLAGDYPADRIEIDARRPVMVVSTLPDAFEAMRDVTPDDD